MWHQINRHAIKCFVRVKTHCFTLVFRVSHCEVFLFSFDDSNEFWTGFLIGYNSVLCRVIVWRATEWITWISAFQVFRIEFYSNRNFYPIILLGTVNSWLSSFSLSLFLSLYALHSAFSRWTISGIECIQYLGMRLRFAPQFQNKTVRFNSTYFW